MEDKQPVQSENIQNNFDFITKQIKQEKQEGTILDNKSSQFQDSNEIENAPKDQYKDAEIKNINTKQRQFEIIQVEIDKKLQEEKMQKLHCINENQILQLVYQEDKNQVSGQKGQNLQTQSVDSPLQDQQKIISSKNKLVDNIISQGIYQDKAKEQKSNLQAHQNLNLKELQNMNEQNSSDLVKSFDGSQISEEEENNFKPASLSHHVYIDWQNLSMAKSSISNSSVQQLNISNRQLVIQKIKDQINKSGLQQKQEKMLQNSLIQNKQENSVDKKFIIKQAQIQRIKQNEILFEKYIENIDNIIKGNENMIMNIVKQIEKRQNYKIVPAFIIQQHFKKLRAINQQFSFNICHIKNKLNQNQKNEKNKNNLINIKNQLSEGFQQLINFRKQLGKMPTQQNEAIWIEEIKQLFKLNQLKYQQNMKTFNQTHNNQQRKLKLYIKSKDKIKNDLRKINSSKSNDIFVGMINFMSSLKQLLDSLKLMGKQFIKLRKNYLKNQIELYQSINTVFTKYKKFQVNFQINKQIDIAKKGKDFQEDLTAELSYQKLCQISDLDFMNKTYQIIRQINSVEKPLQQKRVDFQRQIQQVLSLSHSSFQENNKVCEQLLKNTIQKKFLLKENSEQLIISLNSNLIYFDTLNNKCIEVFKIQQIETQVYGIQVQISDKQNNFFDNPKITVQFSSQDKVQEFLTNLNLEY